MHTTAVSNFLLCRNEAAPTIRIICCPPFFYCAMSTRTADNLRAWMLLKAVARRGTLKDASIECDVNLPQASKLIRALENDLGVALLDRKSRPARLTSFAIKHLPVIEEMLMCQQNLRRAAHEASQFSEATTKIRFGFSVSCVGEHVFECAAQYREEHPNVEVEIFTNKGINDVLDGSIDMVYLMHLTSCPQLLFYPCGVCPNLLLASPSYLAERGVPQTVEDLCNHTLILERRDGFEDPEKIFYRSEMFDLLSAVHYAIDSATGQLSELGSCGNRRPEIRYENDYSSRVATLMGKGIAVDLPLSFVGEHIKNHELTVVLPGWHKRRWKKFLAVKPELMKHPEISEFVHWYQIWEKQNSRQRWKYFFDYFHVSEDVIGSFDA